MLNRKTRESSGLNSLEASRLVWALGKVWVEEREERKPEWNLRREFASHVFLDVEIPIETQGRVPRVVDLRSHFGHSGL